MLADRNGTEIRPVPDSAGRRVVQSAGLHRRANLGKEAACQGRPAQRAGPLSHLASRSGQSPQNPLISAPFLADPFLSRTREMKDGVATHLVMLHFDNSLLLTIPTLFLPTRMTRDTLITSDRVKQTLRQLTEIDERHAQTLLELHQAETDDCTEEVREMAKRAVLATEEEWGNVRNELDLACEEQNPVAKLRLPAPVPEYTTENRATSMKPLAVHTTRIHLVAKAPDDDSTTQGRLQSIAYTETDGEKTQDYQGPTIGREMSQSPEAKKRSRQKGSTILFSELADFARKAIQEGKTGSQYLRDATAKFGERYSGPIKEAWVNMHGALAYQGGERKAKSNLFPDYATPERSPVSAQQSQQGESRTAIPTNTVVLYDRVRQAQRQLVEADEARNQAWREVQQAGQERQAKRRAMSEMKKADEAWQAAERELECAYAEKNRGEAAQLTVRLELQSRAHEQMEVARRRVQLELQSTELLQLPPDQQAAYEKRGQNVIVKICVCFGLIGGAGMSALGESAVWLYIGSIGVGQGIYGLFHFFGGYFERKRSILLLFISIIAWATFSDAWEKKTFTIDKVRVGSYASDGTISDATGQGAASHHGGVSQWIFEDRERRLTPEKRLVSMALYWPLIPIMLFAPAVFVKRMRLSGKGSRR